MDQLRRILSTIQKQLGPLSGSQKLLLGSLGVIVAMNLLLVTQFAGKSQLVPLMPGATPEEQARAATHLQSVGFTVKTVNGNVVVPSDDQYRARAAIAQAGAGPADKRLMFSNLLESQNWTMPKSQLDQMYITALSNELSKVISAFPGIQSAGVFISNPQPTGIGMPARKPTAQVTVFPSAGTTLSPGTVNALADLISGSVAGMQMQDVAVIDGLNKRSHRAAAPDDAFASTYMEQVAKVEERLREKIESHLSAFIPGVVVSVNAIVDAAKRESTTTRVLPKGEGTVALLRKETTGTDTSANTSRSAEPGVGANVGMELTRGGGSGTNTNSEQGETEFENQFGTRTERQQDARGRPTRINATIGIGRDYMVDILKRRGGPAASAAGGAGSGGGGEPTDDQILAAWDGANGERTKIEAMVRPLLETEAGTGAGGGSGGVSAGTVVVSLLPVAVTGPGGLGGGGAAGSAARGLGAAGGLGGVASLLGGDVVRQAFLGALAALAIGMMIVMVRKAGRSQSLPTAEELVGIPPALDPGSDLVGEADQTDTPMIGIEIDADKLKTSKMLEEVTDLVKTNPSSAATVFNRWLATDT